MNLVEKTILRLGYVSNRRVLESLNQITEQAQRESTGLLIFGRHYRDIALSDSLAKYSRPEFWKGFLGK